MDENIIIVVEPDKIQQERFKGILQFHELILVSNGKNAIQEARLHANQISVVLINDKLFDMPSLDVIHEIIKVGLFVPNFIVFSKDESNIISSMTEGGAFEFLPMTTPDSVIVETVEKAIQSQKSVDLEGFRRGAKKQLERLFVDSILGTRNFKMEAELNYYYALYPIKKMPVDSFKDILSELNFAHGELGNRKNFPLKILLKELEDDTGELAPHPWRFKVLIIEDEADMRDGLKALLENDYLVFTSNNAAQALEILESVPDMDIVLLDIGLPDMPGTEVIIKSRALFKAFEATEYGYRVAGPVFIALTAFSDAPTIKQMIKDGVQHYILKPFDQTQLLETVRSSAEQRYYFKAITELLKILEDQSLSFRTRLFLLDAEIKKTTAQFGFHVPTDSHPFFKYFSEYKNAFPSQFPALSLETNLKEFILTIKEEAKQIKNTKWIPLIENCGYQDETLPEIKPQFKTKTSGILIIDDEENYLSALTYILKDLSSEIYQAKNGTEALEIVKKHPNLAVILTDINLPDMNGADLIEKIKKNNPNTAFVVLTGFDSISIPQADKILAKGCDQSDLRNTIQSFINASKEQS